MTQENSLSTGSPFGNRSPGQPGAPVIKHAYLVTAYENRGQLEQLLSLLDDARNDVYLQVDANGTMTTEGLSLQKAKLTLLPPTPMYWGGFSFIHAILGMLRVSTDMGYHHYYHLITGGDLPLVTQQVIHNFLDGLNTEFIDFNREYDSFAKFKAGYYHLLVDTRFYKKYKLARAISHGLVKLQAAIGIDRSRKNKVSYRHGSSYFSITHEFAQYVMVQEAWITKTFRYGLACDEVWLQTLISQSPFRDRVYDPSRGMKGNLRYIDWVRRDKNSPYTFRNNDFDELMNASKVAFFARKFDSKIDYAIIDKITEKLNSDANQRPQELWANRSGLNDRNGS
jgi:hypothetical protein